MLQRVTTFFMGLFCGAVVGASTSLLLTPDSGENLRLKSRAWWQGVLEASTQAAAVRRQQLLAELNQKTTLPQEQK